MKRIFVPVLLLVIIFAFFSTSNAQNLILNFDKTIDWTPSGNPVISEINPKGAASLRPALQLNGESFLQNENGISLGGKDFTIQGWAFVDTNCGSYGRIFEFNISAKGDKNLILSRYGNGKDIIFYADNKSKVLSNCVDRLFHFAIVYEDEKELISLYIDGELRDSIAIKIPERKFEISYIGKSSWDSDGMFVGYLYDFKINDGQALWNGNFMPPSTSEKPVSELNINWKSEGKKEIISDINPKGAASLKDSIQFDGKYYLQAENGISLGGRDFTIDGWAFMDTDCGSYGRIFEFNVSAKNSKNLILSRYGNGSDINFYAEDKSKTISNCVDKLFHFAYVYEHDKNLVWLFINGKLRGKIDAAIPRRFYSLAYLGKSSWDSDGVFVGYIHDFRVTDGKALWKENFVISEDEKPVEEYKINWIQHGEVPTSNINPKGSASLNEALQFDGESYLQAENGISLGGRDFTIDGWAFMDTDCGSYGRIFEFNVSAKNSKNLILSRYGNGSDINFYAEDKSKTISNCVDKLFHFAYVYEHDKNLVWLFINGKLRGKIDAAIPRRFYSLAYLGKSSWDSDGMFVGYIHDFRITDGKALWTENFNLPDLPETPIKEFSLSDFNGGNKFVADGEKFLRNENGIILGGRDFTIQGRAFIDKKCGSYGRIFEFNVFAKSSEHIILSRYGNGSDIISQADGKNKVIADCVDKTFNFDYVYEHKKEILWVYIDGKLKGKIDMRLPRRNYFISYIGKSSWDSDGMFVGNIEDFRVIDGQAVEIISEKPEIKSDFPPSPVEIKNSPSPFDGIFNRTRTLPAEKNKNYENLKRRF